MNILASWSMPTVVAFYPHWFFTALLRGIMGVGQGISSLIIAKWFPMHEKSTAMAIFSTGNQVGLALAIFFTAELCNVVYVGWHSAN
uniref:MFS domain-containing protein n=1 Tax=Panagrellus redivivus TaxID=6233 RepID=A0A7E4VK09_PANRE